LPDEQGLAGAERNWDNWMAVLAAMESNLVSADRPIDDSWLAATPVWLAPADLGPLPDELQDYAAEIARAQDAAIGRLEKRQRTVARHLAVVRTVPSDQATARPPYLDVTG
jgi:hypothetical protein